MELMCHPLIQQKSNKLRKEETASTAISEHFLSGSTSCKKKKKQQLSSSVPFQQSNVLIKPGEETNAKKK